MVVRASAHLYRLAALDLVPRGDGNRALFPRRVISWSLNLAGTQSCFECPYQNFVGWALNLAVEADKRKFRGLELRYDHSTLPSLTGSSYLNLARVRAWGPVAWICDCRWSP